MFEKAEYIWALYETGSFSRAADKLFISQPSLSAAIKKEEERLGAPLFERKSSGVTLTEVGEEYIKALSEVRRIDENLRRKLDDIYNVKSGHITVGGTNYLSSYVLPGIIKSFSSKHPNVEVTLKEGNSALLSKLLEDEQIDIVIDSFDENMDAYCGYRLAKERIFLCVPSDRKINDDWKEYRIHPEEIYNGTVDPDSISPVDLRAFRKESFVLLKPENDMYRRAMSIFKHYRINPKVLLSVDQLNISYALASSGMGLCFATDTLFRFGRFRENVVLYNIEKSHSDRVLYVAYKKNRYCTHAMREFINTAKEQIGERFAPISSD